MKIALPRRASHQERIELVGRIMEGFTDGRSHGFAAIHDKSGNDAQNPHVHIAIWDKDAQTGRRVYGFSERWSTRRARHDVAGVINAWYAEKGWSERIDPRSFKDRGLEKLPQLHVGPGAKKLAALGIEPESKTKIVGGRNGRGFREIRYPEIDLIDGRTGEVLTRMKANELIRNINASKDRERVLVAERDRESARADEFQGKYERLVSALGTFARRLGMAGKVKVSEIFGYLAGLVGVRELPQPHVRSVEKDERIAEPIDIPRSSGRPARRSVRT